MVDKSGGRLLIPFALWSGIYTAKKAIFDGVSLRSLIISFAIGKAATPLYYILVLLQLTVCTLFLVKRKNKWMYFITPIYLIVLYIYNFMNGKMPVCYETLFPAWFIFYLVGMDVREGKFNNYRIRVWMILAGLIMSIGEAALLLKIGCSIEFASSQIKFSSFIYSMLLVLWLAQNVKIIRPNILSVVGDCSFGIYFFHALAIWPVGKLLSIARVNVWLERWVITFAITTCTSFGVVWMARKKFGGSEILKCIGFE